VEVLRSLAQAMEFKPVEVEAIAAETEGIVMSVIMVVEVAPMSPDPLAM